MGIKEDFLAEYLKTLAESGAAIDEDSSNSVLAIAASTNVMLGRAIGAGLENAIDKLDQRAAKYIKELYLQEFGEKG